MAGTPGKVSSPDEFHKRDPEDRWPAPQDLSPDRHLEAGHAEGKCCCAAEDEDVYDCLQAVGRQWQGTTYRLVGRNCRDFVRDALRKCCLNIPGIMDADLDRIIVFFYKMYTHIGTPSPCMPPPWLYE